MPSPTSLLRALRVALPLLLVLDLVGLAVPASASASVVIRRNGSRWAEIEDDGDIYVSGSRVGEITDDGYVYRNGSRIGEITSSGYIYRNGSRVAEMTGDGYLYVNGSRVAEITSRGAIYRDGSRWGDAEACCSARQTQWVAAVLVLFESGLL